MGLVEMANKGRAGDTMIVHATPGEIVIPREVAALRPDLVAHVGQQIRLMGGNPSNVVVGRGRINPATGIQEFATQEEVTAAYQQTLGRAPDAAGMAYWTQGNNYNPQAFAAAAMPEKAISSAYSSSFGRPAEQAGYDYWTKQGAGNSNYDYAGEIRKAAQGQDIVARGDIDAGGVDTTKTWGSGASLSDPRLRYDAANNTWGTAETPSVPSPPLTGAGVPGLVGAVPKPTALMRTITPEETVRGQLNALIAEDSPYLQSAKNYALAGMNDRGLASSSLAIGAAQRAAIDAATPIAGQDATTYATSGLSAQNANQGVDLTGYQAGLKEVSDKQAAGYASELQRQKDDAYATLNLSLKQIDKDLEIQKINLQDRDSFAKTVGPIMQQYQGEFAKIQIDPNFANPDEKAAAIQRLNDIYQPQISAINSIYGYDLKWDNIPPPTTAPTAPTAQPMSSGTDTPPDSESQQVAEAGYPVFVADPAPLPIAPGGYKYVRAAGGWRLIQAVNSDM